MKHKQTLTTLLAYAGVIPFLLGFMFLLLPKGEHITMPFVHKALCIYGLMIASFLLGSYWGNSLDPNKYNKLYVILIIMSNVLLVFTWVIYLVTSFNQFCVFLGLLFLILLSHDYWLLQRNELTLAYFRMRVIVTLVVSFLLFCSAIVG